MKMLHLLFSRKTVAGVLLLAVLFLSNESRAQIWNVTTGQWLNASEPGLTNPQDNIGTIDPNLSAVRIQAVGGVTANAAASRFNFKGWSSATSNTPAVGTYFEFTLTPAAGYHITVSSFAFTDQASGTGPGKNASPGVEVRSSLDGYASPLGTCLNPNNTSKTQTITVGQITNAAVTFRVYGYAVSSAAGTFSINSFTFNGVVAQPTINVSGSLSTFSTIYGTPSAVQSVAVSGTNLTSDITATAPAGYEISNNNATWGNTTTFAHNASTGVASSQNLYVRLKANAPVAASYDAASIALTSQDIAAPVLVSTPVTGNDVAPFPLTITASDVTKTAGDALTTGSGSADFTTDVPLPNGEVITGVTISYGSAADAGAAVGDYPGEVTASLPTGIDVTNYDISFVPGIIHVAPDILPLTFLSFDAQWQNGGAVLQWQTANEVNTGFFQVERSTDGRHFTAIDRIAAKGIVGTNRYDYTDSSVPDSVTTVYYRIGETDLDGRPAGYTRTVPVATGHGSAVFSVQVYPNPASDQVWVNGNDIQTIRLTDNTGRVYTIRQATPGTATLLSTATLPAGIYFIQVSNSKGATVAQPLRIVK